MADANYSRRSDYNYDRYKSPVLPAHDRYTPASQGAVKKKKYDAFTIDNTSYRTPRDEEPHFNSSTPPLIHTDRQTPTSFATTNKRKPNAFFVDNRVTHTPNFEDTHMKPSSPPIRTQYVQPIAGPLSNRSEKPLNHNPISDRHSPSINTYGSRMPPAPVKNSVEPKNEIYHIPPSKGPSQLSKPIQDNHPMPKHNNEIIHHDEQRPKKVTVYYLTTTTSDNPTYMMNRTPTPPIHPTKAPAPGVLAGQNKDNKQIGPKKPLETTHSMITTNTQPIIKSKASQSINRSMMKYLFGIH